MSDVGHDAQERESAAARAEMNEPAEDARPVWELIFQLHALMKSLMLHDASHVMAERAATGACRAIASNSPPFVLQFVAGGVFMDRTLVPLDFEHFQYCQALALSLGRLSAHELSFDSALEPSAAVQLGAALAAGTRGQVDFLKEKQIPGLIWRDIPYAKSGIDAEGVDPEVAAVAHVVIGLSVVEQITNEAESAWPWNMGLSAVRRFEKGLSAKEGVAMRVVEFAPDGWNRSRRAVSAALLVLDVLTKVNADPAHRRAAAHATLALCLEGLGERGGMPVGEAAMALGHRITSAPVQARSGVAPQCLLVATLVHLMHPQVRQRRDLVALGVTDLIELAYTMEAERCPQGVPFDLSRADLLATAIGAAGAEGVGYWVRAMIKVCGTVPVGACVQLADGRIGTVIEPGPAHNPWCPVVFIDGQRVMTQQPVMLVPPNKRRRVG